MPYRLSQRALTIALLFTGVAQAAPLYNIRDITPAGYASAIAYDVNADGDAVGIASTGGTSAFFFYDSTTGTSSVFGVGVVVPRHGIFGGDARSVALNDSGTIAGSAMFVGGVAETRAFVGTTSSFTNLGTFPATSVRPASAGKDVNASGLVVGNATAGAAVPGADDAFTAMAAPISDIDGAVDIATAGDRAWAVNDSGVVVGENQDRKAVRFSGGAETLLLAGTALAADTSAALDVNNDGDVIGATLVSNASFFYDGTTGVVTVLPNLGTGARVGARALNGDGDVVGKADRDGSLDGQARGFLYRDGTMHELGALISASSLEAEATEDLAGWGRILTAWSINDDGVIVGVGERRPTGAAFPSQRAYLLTPVPLPAAGPMLVVVLAVCAAFVRRAR